MPENTSITIKEGTTGIGQGAFRNRKDLVSVTIPNSVKSIGIDAFAGCSGITSLEIPNGVVEIGSGAFCNCTGLTSVDIPNSVINIGPQAFRDCSELVSVTFPNSIKFIGAEAFSKTAWLNNQEDGLIYAGNVAYMYKGTMPENSSITIKEGTTVIGDWVFSGKAINSVYIPNSVVSIGKYAFSGCSGLSSVSIPNSVVSIGEGAFRASGLSSVSIPNSVVSIGQSAFFGCINLTSIEIPSSISEIGATTFSGCSSLTSVSIPNSVTYIGFGAFQGCSNLSSVIVPNSVAQIEGHNQNGGDIGAFQYCKGLISVTILNSAIEVYNQTFFGCDGLTSATVEITDVATWCAKPSTFEVPASCTRYLTLNGNIIKDLVIPQSVTSIGDGAFSNCNSLTSVKVEWNRPLAGGAASIPEDVKKNAPLYVPKGTAMMYMSAPGWSEFVNIIEYEDGEDAHYITIRMGDGGVLKQSVEVGQTYTYAVSVDEGWEVNTLTFDGKDMTSLLLDGQFSTPVITGNSELNVVFKQKDTSVKDMPSMSEVKVYASNKSITITGAEENAPVSVYGINGALVTSAVGNATFSLESGMYIVKVGEETFKVRL